MSDAIKKLIESGKWQPIEKLPRDEDSCYLILDGDKIDVDSYKTAFYDAKDDLWLFNAEYEISHDDVIEQSVEFIKPDDRLANALEIAVEALNKIRAEERSGATSAELSIIAGDGVIKMQTIAEATNG